MGNADSIISLENVTVSFDGFLALRDLNFKMREGEFRFVIGPNGAGKTTLLDVVTGKVRPVKGRVMFDERVDLCSLEPQEIAALGIGRKFQTPSVFPHHSVLENMILALRTFKGVWKTLRARLNRTQINQISEILGLVGLAEEVSRPAGTLSHGQKQWLEIAMLLAQEPRLLLLDEPAAGMTGGERDQTAKLLESVSASHSVLVIEHDMEFVRRLAKTVTVLHEGTLLCEGTMKDVQNDPVVIDVYLGRSLEGEPIAGR